MIFVAFYDPLIPSAERNYRLSHSLLRRSLALDPAHDDRIKRQGYVTSPLCRVIGPKHVALLYMQVAWRSTKHLGDRTFHRTTSILMDVPVGDGPAFIL